MARVRGRQFATARVRMAVCGAVGVAVGAVVARWVHPIPAVLIGWDSAAAGYLAWSMLGTRNLGASVTARLALREDPGRTGLDLLLIAASVASLVGVGLVVTSGDTPQAHNSSAGLAVVTVVAGWSLVHTVFTERYARLYYTDTPGGIDFGGPEPPSYRDFAYLSFTVGMTFQVSDTNVTAKEIRATVLRHALLSYLFGAVIIATSVNLVASLAS